MVEENAPPNGSDGTRRSPAGGGGIPLVGWGVVVAVAGVGALGVGYAVGYFFGTSSSLGYRVVTLSLPLVFSLVLLYVALGLYRGVYDVAYDTVARWGVVGVVGVGVVGGWYPLVASLGTFETGFAYVLALCAGTLAGVLLGLYNSQRVRIEELERYEAIVESVRDGVFAVEDGTVTIVNPAMADMIGVDRGAMEGEDVGELVRKLIPGDAVDDATARTLDGLADRERIEVDVEPVDRGQITCEVGVSSLDSGTDQLVGVTREVSRYKRLQQQLSVTNRILRHNLRTSMNLISGHARIVEVDAVDEETAERARAARLEAEDLADLANKAQLLSEIIEHEYGSSLVETDAASVARDAVAVVREEFPNASYEVDADGEYPVRAHPQIARAVAEAVENAVVHADVSPPVVRVSVRRADGFAEIRVADEGPGIPHYEREVIERGTETDLEHGSGLGLWLINWIVDLSDGELRFEGGEGRGEVVVVGLPVADEGDGEGVATPLADRDAIGAAADGGDVTDSDRDWTAESDPDDSRQSSS